MCCLTIDTNKALDCRLTLGTQLYKNLQIQNMLINLQAFYFLKQQGKKPQGKVYDKYFNCVRHLKNNGILTKRTNSAEIQRPELEHIVQQPLIGK